MLSKCANPQCTAPFHYLRDGKLFQIDRRGYPGPELVTDKKPVQRVEYFWLCGQCSETLTLKYENGKGVIAVPIAQAPAPFIHRAAIGA